MRKFLLSALLVSATLTACKKAKDFSKITSGMPSIEVERLVGKPEQKTPFLLAEIWQYGSHIITFHADTVVNVMSNEEFQQLGADIKKGFDNMQNQIDSVINEFDNAFTSE